MLASARLLGGGLRAGGDERLRRGLRRGGTSACRNQRTTFCSAASAAPSSSSPFTGRPFLDASLLAGWLGCTAFTLTQYVGSLVVVRTHTHFHPTWLCTPTCQTSSCEQCLLALRTQDEPAAAEAWRASAGGTRMLGQVSGPSMIPTLDTEGNGVITVPILPEWLPWWSGPVKHGDCVTAYKPTADGLRYLVLKRVGPFLSLRADGVGVLVSALSTPPLSTPPRVARHAGVGSRGREGESVPDGERWQGANHRGALSFTPQSTRMRRSEVHGRDSDSTRRYPRATCGCKVTTPATRTTPGTMAPCRSRWC
jgi:hypothetical protein